MSKKRFSEGLDDLFRNVQGEELAIADAVTDSQSVSARRHAGKNFITDLDALLQEALEESLEKYDANQPDTVTASSKSKSTFSNLPPRGSMSGLDVLIRQTIDVQELSTDETTGKKRLTVAVDKSKLERLKTIARLENAYLKDLLVGLIDEYINEYSREKGIPL